MLNSVSINKDNTKRPSSNRQGRIIAVAASSIAALAMLAGCSSGNAGKADADQSSQSQAPAASTELPVVAVSSYPLAFLASSVGGDDIVLEDLSASSGDAHHLELSPAQVNEISKASLVLYIGDGFQQAMEDAIKVSNVDSMDVLTAVPADELISGDPHVWLDPLIAADLGDAIAERLAEANPADADAYKKNAASLREELEEQNAEYEKVLAECSGQTLLTSHEAFGYMAKRYGLEQVGVLGVDPDAEPSPARIAEVQKLITERGITTLFVEPIGGHSHDEDDHDHDHDAQSEEADHDHDEADHDHDEADHDHDEADHDHEGHDHVHLTSEQQTAISKALGIPAITLDPMETQVDASKDFLAIMHSNLHALSEGLTCAVHVH